MYKRESKEMFFPMKTNKSVFLESFFCQFQKFGIYSIYQFKFNTINKSMLFIHLNNHKWPVGSWLFQCTLKFHGSTPSNSKYLCWFLWCHWLCHFPAGWPSIAEHVLLVRLLLKVNLDGALGAAWPSLRSTSAPDTAWVSDSTHTSRTRVS